MHLSLCIIFNGRQKNWVNWMYLQHTTPVEINPFEVTEMHLKSPSFTTIVF